MVERSRSTRIHNYRPLPSPAEVLGEFPLDDRARRTVESARQDATAILEGRDDRLLVVAGPCSTHDPVAALDYASRLRTLAAELAGDLCVVMRVYFEKPRTTTGWKGLINDPRLDGSCAGEEGLRRARELLVELAGLGVPAGCEFLDPTSSHYIADAVAWGAIGARTTESQIHRQLASGLPMPVGFKNGTDGRLQAATDAMRAAASPHTFFGVAEKGAPTVVSTTGNEDSHIILRGGRGGPNYEPEHVTAALDTLRVAGLPERVVIDGSHGNSGKDYRRQPTVAGSVAAQVAAGHHAIIGIMLESFLVDGRQPLGDPAALTYGQSITDSCMGWDMTVPVLRRLAEAVRARRCAGAEGGHASQHVYASW